MIVIVDPGINKIVYSFFTNENNVLKSKKIILNINRLDDLSKSVEPLTKGNDKCTITAISIRIVWGGIICKQYTQITYDFLNSLDALFSQNPTYFEIIKKFLKILLDRFPGLPLYAFFETSFFKNLPAEEKKYAVSNDMIKTGTSPRSGYHGIWHDYNAGIPHTGKIMSIVFDTHTTVCSISGNTPLSINLGSSPLEGIMGQRTCGDIDPGIVFYFLKQLHYSIFNIDYILKKKSGFFGVTGYDRKLSKLIDLYNKEEKVTLAFDMYINQILKYFGYGITLLKGLDSIVLSGSYLRYFSVIIFKLLKQISFLGINLKELPWTAKNSVYTITTEDSSIPVYLNELSLYEIMYNRTLELKNIE